MPCGEPPGGLAFLKKGAGAGGPCTGMALRGPGGQEPLSLAKKGFPTPSGKKGAVLVHKGGTISALRRKRSRSERPLEVIVSAAAARPYVYWAAWAEVSGLPGSPQLGQRSEPRGKL